MREEEKKIQVIKEKAMQMLRWHYSEGDTDKVLDSYTDDIVWVGYGKGQIISGKDSLRDVFYELEKRMLRYDILEEEYMINPLCEKRYLCVCTATLATRPGQTIKRSYSNRVSMLFDYNDGDPKCVHVHASKPDSSEYQTLLMDQVGWKAYNTVKEKELEALRNLQSQNDLLDNVYQTMPTGIVRQIEDGEKVRILMTNPAAIRILGYDSYEEYASDRKEGLAGRLMREDRMKIKKQCEHALVNQWDTVETMGRIRYKDGSIHYIKAHNTLISAPGEERTVQRILYDVTDELLSQERKAKELRMDYLERMFRVFSAHTEDAYIMFSPKDYQVEYVSPNLLRLTGITVKEAYENILNLLHPESSKQIFEEAVKGLFMEKPYTKERERIHLISGEKRWFRESLFKTKFNREDKVLMILSDRTEEQDRERVLREALQHAEVANKAKSSFLSDMSHDIRTPMNAIVGLVELLRREDNLSDNAKEKLKQLETSSNLMMELVNNILDMSRIESGKVANAESTIFMREFLEETLAILRVQAKLKKIKVEERFRISAQEYMGDMVGIRKILLNFTSNAVKYTQEGGNIFFGVESQESKMEGYSNLCFTVKDNGIGMSKEFAEKIFEPFSREENTTKSSVGGTGLGMPIAKALVDSMGGVINVETEKGVGTTFTIIIPMKNVEASQMRLNLEELSGRTSFDGLRFLIVEDNDINAEILEELLKDEGIICERAHNGLEAVELFDKSSENHYDMILMDVQMPIMNGYEATREIRKSSHPRAQIIPIVAMTANAFTEDVNDALEAGMNVHITKPIRMNLLRSTMRRLL